MLPLSPGSAWSRQVAAPRLEHRLRRGDFRPPLPVPLRPQASPSASARPGLRQSGARGRQLSSQGSCQVETEATPTGDRVSLSSREDGRPCPAPRCHRQASLPRAQSLFPERIWNRSFKMSQS